MNQPRSGPSSRRRAAAAPGPSRACQEKIFFPAPDGTRLCGILHRPAVASRSGVLLCHGMMSSKDGDKHRLLAEMLVQRGHWVLRFDFAGRGESGGDFLALSITRQAGEAGAALRILKARGLDRVGVEGSSLGGAAAIRLASRGGVDALVTWAAVGRADRLAEGMAGREGMERWRRDGVRRVDGQEVGFSLIEDARRQDLLAAAARVRCPWLIVHGARDEVVPRSDAEELYRAAGGPAGSRVSLEILPAADHQFTAPGDRRRLLDLSADFFQRQLGRAARAVRSGARPGKEVA